MKINQQLVLENPEFILQFLQGINLDQSLVYLTGSLMEGFGNQTSDIDVYVITDRFSVEENPEVETEDRIWEDNALIRNVIHEGVRFDFEYWTWDDFNRSIDDLKAIDVQSERSMQQLPTNKIDLLHRLKFGKPIVNQERFDEMYRSIPFENLGYYLAVVHVESVGGVIEDVQGAMLSEDLGSAFFMSRRLIDLVVTAYLAVHNQTNPKVKWLYRKLERYQEATGDTQLLEKYLDLQSRPYENAAVRGFVKEALQFCQKLNVKTQSELQKKQTV